MHMGPGQLGQVALLAAGVNWGCNLLQQVWGLLLLLPLALQRVCYVAGVPAVGRPAAHCLFHPLPVSPALPHSCASERWGRRRRLPSCQVRTVVLRECVHTG